MMRYKIVALIALSFFVYLPGQIYAGNTDINKKLDISVPFKLQIFENDKPTEQYMVGTLLIINSKGDQLIFWDSVFISPLHSQKIVKLKSESYNSKDDVFEDVSITENNFYFTIVMPPYANRIKVTGYKKPGQLYHSIKGEGLFKEQYLEDKPVKIEWRQVDKITLPYKEVY
jgi:hypothetical protein